MTKLPEITAPMRRLADQTAGGFRQQFGRPPEVLALAPGRVNLIGEHTDYNDGFALPMTIDRFTCVAAGIRIGVRQDRHAASQIGSTLFPELRTLPDPESDARPSPGDWISHPCGVLAGCREKGFCPPPIQAWVDSTIPRGSGLSSSAALNVAFAMAVAELSGQSFGRIELAMLCQKAEREWASVPCGLMDPVAVLFGQAKSLLFIDFRGLAIQPVGFDPPGLALLVIDSGVRHSLGESGYPLRREQCARAAAILGVASLRELSPPRGSDPGPARHKTPQDALDGVLRNRVRHVVSENSRVLDALESIQKGDWNRLGRLMSESHHSLKTDYEVSCPEVDLLVEIAEKTGPHGGVLGARMTGGGFGGCTVNLVQRDRVDAIRAAVEAEYATRTGLHPVFLTCMPSPAAFVAPFPL